MNKNYYVIEKYKKSFDSQGNEVLTKIPYDTSREEYVGNNYININLRQAMSTVLSRPASIISVDAATRSFKDASIFVTEAKILTKSLTLYMQSNGSFTTDASYSGNDKFIVGSAVDGVQVSPITEGDTNVITTKFRFEAPSSGVRTINTVALGNIDLASSWVPHKNILSCILLDAPCLQRDDEILIITYRYTYNAKVLVESTGLHLSNPALANKFAKAKAIGGTTDLGNDLLIGKPHYAKVSSCSAVIAGKEPLIYRNFSSIYDVLSKVFINKIDSYYSEGLSKLGINLTVNDLNGKLVNSIVLFSEYPSLSAESGVSNNYSPVYPMSEAKMRKPKETCVQNTYPKLLSSSTDLNYGVVRPFFDLSNTGTSLGNVVIADIVNSGEEDTSYLRKGSMAELYRTKITQSGKVGDSQYELYKRVIGSFDAINNWMFEPTSLIQGGRGGLDKTSGTSGLLNNSFNETKEFVGGLEYPDYQAYSGMIQPLQLGEFLVFNPVSPTFHRGNGGLWVHHVDPNNSNYPIKIDSTTVPGFGATDIRGFTTAEDGTFFVACASTGLWKLKRSLNQTASATVANKVVNTGVADDTKAYAINFFRKGGHFESTGKLYALFNNELAVSSDGGENWTTYNSTTNPAFDLSTEIPDFGVVTGMVANEYMTPNEVCVVTADTTTLGVYYPDGQDPSYSSGHKATLVSWLTDGSSVKTYTNSIYGLPFYRARCGGNALVIPTNSTNYPWATIFTTSQGRGYLMGINSALNVADYLSSASEGIWGALPMYDSVTDEVLILYHDERNRDSQGYDVFIAGTPDNIKAKTNLYVSKSFTQETQYYTYLGRGVLFLVGGTNNSNIYGSTVNSNNRSMFYKFWKTMALSFEKYNGVDVGGADFFRNNRFNWWYKYGWDSVNSKWLLDSTGSKQTHLTSEPLVGGLFNQFTNSTDLPDVPDNFVSGEVFDTFVFDGVLKDDYTEVTSEVCVFHGASVKGTDFSVPTVPANPAGIVTQELSVRYLSEFANSDDFTRHSPKFERDFVGVGKMYDHGGNIAIDKNYALLGEPLTSDFTMEFRLGLYFTNNVFKDNGITYNSNTVAAMPLFGLANSNTATAINGHYHPIAIGISCSHVSGDSDKLRIYFKDESNVQSHQEVTYNPLTDKFKFVKDGNLVKFLHNDVELFNSTCTIPSLNFMYHGKGDFISSFSNSTRNNPDIILNILDAKVTFNENRHIAYVGSEASSTGAFDPDFGKLHIKEYELGISKILIDGVEAYILLDNGNSEPAQGEVRVNRGNGKLIFNAADAGKVISGNWRMIPCINSRGG